MRGLGGGIFALLGGLALAVSASAAEPVRMAMHDMNMPMQGGGAQMDSMNSMPKAPQGSLKGSGDAGMKMNMPAGAMASRAGSQTNPIIAVFGAPERIEGRIAFFRAELGITESQAGVWEQFAEALRVSRRHLQEAQAALEHAHAQMTSAERLEEYERHLSSRLESLRTARTAFTQLRSVLDDRQRKEADELLLPFFSGF